MAPKQEEANNANQSMDKSLSSVETDSAQYNVRRTGGPLSEEEKQVLMSNIARAACRNPPPLSKGPSEREFRDRIAQPLERLIQNLQEFEDKLNDGAVTEDDKDETEDLVEKFYVLLKPENAV